jgi:hypothetical protein
MEARSQLKRVLGRPNGRSGLFVLAVAVIGCDRMISDRFPVIPPVARGAGGVAEVSRLTGLARDTLASCGARAEHVAVRGSTVTWRNPDQPPGLTIYVASESVRLSQHLYGPVNATATYQCVRDTLAQRLRAGLDRTQVPRE